MYGKPYLSHHMFSLTLKNYMYNLREMPLVDMRSPPEVVEMLWFFRKWQ